MKTHLRFLWCCFALLCVAFTSSAQLTGTITVPSTLYPTLDSAIRALNAQGVGTGGVIVNLTAGETAPVGGYQLGSATLNASTSASQQVTIRGNGNTLTGYVGTSTTTDGIFFIRGTDYVKLTNLKFAESSANTTSTTRMEWGISLVKLGSAVPYDGCQNVTIDSCTITLTKTYSGTIGIRAANTLANSTTTLGSTGNNAASTNSYNVFTANNISGVTRGISLVGITSDVALYDKNNRIGGTTAASGNIISAGGGTNTSYGIFTQNDSVMTIRSNRLSIATGQDADIYMINTSTGVGDLTVADNNINLSCSTPSGWVYGYYNSSGHRDASSGTGSASTHTITGNVVYGDNTSSTSGYVYGIYESAAYCRNLNISNDTVRDMNWGTSSGYMYCLYESGSSAPNLNCANNMVYNIQQNGTSGYLYALYCQNSGAPAGSYMSVRNNLVRRLKHREYNVYTFYAYGGSTSTQPQPKLISVNNVIDSVDVTTSTSYSYIYTYFGYYGGDSSLIANNTLSNVTSGSAYSYVYTYMGYSPSSSLNPTYRYTSRKNLVTDLSGANMSPVTYLDYYVPLADSNEVRNVKSTTGGGFTTYLNYYKDSSISRNNYIHNINMAGSTWLYNYIGQYNYGAQIYGNVIDSLSTQSGGIYAMSSYPYGGLTVSGNRVSRLYTNSASTYVYGMDLGGSSGVSFTVYNNMISDLYFGNNFNGTAVAMNLSSSADYRVYNNTIRINPGTPASVTGIYYYNSASLDLRNNIINVNATPPAAGLTAALRRSSGAAGTVPFNLLSTSNGNIFYAPNLTNSFLYTEGSIGSLANSYNLTNDPNFNTACGLFKTFMQHNFGSFTEDNLVASTTPFTYKPSGLSFAEKGAVATPIAITTDLDGAPRGAIADMGALEFTGVVLDQAPPVITYTALPTLSYCLSVPQIVATITDVSGVNNTTGTAPRLYYKKANSNTADADVFGVPNNSTGNGWKYVEATTIVGNQYTFDFDYSLLRSPVVLGDSIKYFIIAQDLAAVPNTGFNLAGFSVCPSSVNLTSANSPLAATPETNGFRLKTTPTFVVDGFPPAVCQSGSTVLSILPVPSGSSVQWESASLTGSFSPITGATGYTYTTPVLTTTTRYRAVLSCGSSALSTTPIDTFIVANPSIISAAGATICGFDSARLSVVTAPYSTGKWYTAATGGRLIASGNTYTTPQLGSSRTYYVSAVTSNAGLETISFSKPASVYSYSNYVGVTSFMFYNPSTNFYSTTIYPDNATVGSRVEIDIYDSIGYTRLTPLYPTTAVNIPFAGNGMTPLVVNLPWRNLKPNVRYYVVVTPSGGAQLHFHYVAPPVTSASGGAQIIATDWGGNLNSYNPYLYNNIIGKDCESAARTPVTVTVTPAPPITASSPQTPGVCIGTSVTVRVVSANPYYTYTWQPLNRIDSVIMLTPTTTTTYKVTAKDPFTGCVAVDSVTVAVNPQPLPPVITPNPTTICSGNAVQLTATSPPVRSGVGTLGTATTTTSSPSPVYSFYTKNNVQYLVTAAELNAMGIVGKCSLTSWAFNVATTGYKTNNFRIQIAHAGNTSSISSLACYTATGGFTTVYQQAALTAALGWNTFNFQTNFAWDGVSNIIIMATFDNEPTCTTSDYSTAPTIYYTATSSNTVAYAFTDVSYCNMTSCSPSYTGSGSTYRANMQIGYLAPGAINWLNVTNLYRNPALTTPISLTDTATSPYAAPTTTTVYRAVTNYQGCKSVPSNPDTVYVVPSPDVTLTPAGRQTVCAGQSVTMCVPTGVNQTYQWTRNGTAIAGATSNCYTATTAGAYGVTVSNLLTGCVKSSLNDTVTVNPGPTVTVTRRGAATICKGTQDTLVATGTNIVSYQWKESGVAIAGATGSSLIVTATGTYTVDVTGTDGCVVTSAPETINVNVTPTTITPLGPTTFCAGNSVVLQAPTAPAGTTYTYQWRVGATTIAGATSNTYTASTSGSYTVLVTNTTTGCRDSSSATVVNAGANPPSTITPNGNVGVCAGSSVTLTATQQPGLTYQWYVGGTAITGATASTYTVTTAGVYTVRVSLTASPTCNSVGDNNATVTVNPQPVATATIVGSGTACQGTAVVINAGPTTGVTYQWNLNGTAIAGQTGASISATTSGSYTVTVTSTTTGCSATSAPAVVTINTPPSSTITPSGATTFCQGGNVNLCVPTGASSYQWRLNGTNIPGTNTACYTATATGLYSVLVTGSNGCSAVSAATSVQVNPLPNATTTPTGTAAVCQGSSIALSAIADTNYTYQWLLNNVNITANAQSAVYNASAAGTYKVRVTNKVTGCSAVSADIILTVNTPPTATATLTGPAKICQGDSARIDATTGSGFSYQWRLNGVNIPGATSPTFFAKQSGSYTVNVSNTANCFSTSNSIVITVDPRPAAFITYSTPLEFCEGSAVVLTANTGTGLTYQWYMNGTANGNTTQFNVSRTTGRYSLRVTNSFGCSTFSDSLSVVVYPTPVPTVVRNGASLETTVPYVSYQWFLNNEPIGGATSQSYNYTTNGAYKVRVIDMYGCEGMSNLFFITNVGVQSTAAGKAIRIYPNPTTAIVNIESSVKVKVVLRDVAGKVILEASDVKQINLGDVANGMYMLYISDMNGTLLRAEKVTKTAN